MGQFLAQHSVATLLRHYIVSNGCNTVLTMQPCVVLKIVIADHSMYPCNTTFKPGGVCYLKESDTFHTNTI